MDFTGTQMIDFALAGTPAADALIGAKEMTTCCRCGARISNVFIVDVPSMGHALPMGGDCLATVTGDNSTRRMFAKVMRTLPGVDFTYLQVRGDVLWACSVVRIREWDGSAVTKDRPVAKGNASILTAAALHYLDTVGRSYNFRRSA